MRVFIVIIFISLVHKFTYAQNDFQEKTPAKSPAWVQADVDRLNNLANDIFLAFPDSAHKLAANALLLSEKYNYSAGKGRSFLNLGIIYWSQSYYAISLFYLRSALPFLSKNEPLYLSEGYKALGRTYADLNDYKRALSDLDTAARYAGTDPGALERCIAKDHTSTVG